MKYIYDFSSTSIYVVRLQLGTNCSKLYVCITNLHLYYNHDDIPNKTPMSFCLEYHLKKLRSRFLISYRNE